MDNILQLLSIATIVPAIFLSFIVVKDWGGVAIESVYKRQRESEDWLILGIAIAFCAFIVNSSYWGLYVISTILGAVAFSEFLSSIGLIVNIFTRNIPYIIAALCHIISFDKYRKRKRLNSTYIYALVFLFLSTFILFSVL